MKFGDILRNLINDREITQRRLASDLNIAPSTLGNYIQDSREPDFQTLKDIANYFNVTVDYLIDNRSPYTKSRNEEEILRIYRSLSPEQQDLYLEQGKLLLRHSLKENVKSSKSTSQNCDKVG
ncbi:MAG: helix-turn-helix transcriptional regulator [Clostridiales bacterium]|nr:helix-turn-helix transcriptional regulator [Clostridiales bacterium]